VYLIRPKAPWYYLAWCPTETPPDVELALANLIRRKGHFYLLRIFWGVVTGEGDRFTLGCAWILLAYNYPLLVCAIGYWLEFTDFGTLGGAWLLSFAWGTARHLAWQIALVNRWPPMASN